MGLSGIGPMELVVVLVIALIILGPKRLPEVGRSVGKGMREFKDSISGTAKDDDDDDLDLQIHASKATPEPTSGSTAATSAAAPRPE